MGVAVRKVVVGILVFPGCQESGLTAPLDVFRILDAISVSRPPEARVELEVRFISTRGGNLQTAAGMGVQTQAADVDQLDALIVPGIHHRTADEISQATAVLEVEAALIAQAAQSGKAVLASCSGVFLLGKAGVLEGRRATTSWWLGPALRAAFPGVHLEADGRIVADDACVSAGGVTSYHDLALWLVERFAGREARHTCARFLLLDLDRQTQTPFVIDSLIEKPREDLIVRARSWLNQRLTTAFRIEELASHCGVSQRTLLRRFRATTDRTPARYVQTLRLERAKALLEATRLSVAEVASECGYTDPATFRKIFKLRIRLTPQQYRSRLGPPNVD